eukprot:7972975-Pyramimonas_sp.AAC.2
MSTNGLTLQRDFPKVVLTGQMARFQNDQNDRVQLKRRIRVTRTRMRLVDPNARWMRPFSAGTQMG